MLENTAEKGHCLFCDAVFDNNTAFSIAADSNGVEFPNLPQPIYEGPSLEPKNFVYGSGQMAVGKKQSQPAAKKPKAAAAPAYVAKEAVKLPEFKLSKKAKLRALLITLAVLLITAAISVPIVLNRDRVQEKLLDSMAGIAPFSIDAEKAVAIRKTTNSYLLIATDQTVTSEDMVDLFKAYCEKRAEIMNIDSTSFAATYGNVSVKLFTPDGGYLISKPQDMPSLDSGAAVDKLNP